MNKVAMIGNLTSDPELKTAGNNKVAVFRLAVARNYRAKDKERETDFFPCEAWGKIGENFAKLAKKGSRVAVWGEIQNHQWTDKNNNNRIESKIVMDGFEFCGTRPDKMTKTVEQFVPVTEDDDLPF